MNNPNNPKERNLLKGAMRRIFSRSDLRKAVLEATVVVYSDPERKRVKRWSRCEECKKLVPTYTIEVDHIIPIILPEETMEDLTWDKLIDRIWCQRDNLRGVCGDCHDLKTKAENKIRAENRKKRKAAK